MALATPWAVAKSRLLLCEGPDDESVLARLLGPVEDLQIRGCGGYPNVLLALRGLASVSGVRQLQRLVVVVDSDDDPVARLQSLRDTCQRHLPAGLELRLLLVPAENEPGALESLYLQDMATAQQLACIEQLFDCFGAGFRAANRAKIDKQRLQLLSSMLHSKRDQLLWAGVFEQAALAGGAAPQFPRLQQLQRQLVAALSA